jgi:hypothetical protein
MSNFPDDMRHENLEESEADREFESRHTKTQEIIQRLIPLCRLLDPCVVDSIIEEITENEDDINVEDFPTFHSGPEHTLDRKVDFMPSADCPLCGTHADTSDVNVWRQVHRIHGQPEHINLIHADCIMACKDIAASDKELGDDHPWWETDCLLDVVDIEWLETAYPSIAARIAEKTNGQFSD